RVALAYRRDAGRTAQVQNRLAAGTKRHTLIRRRQKTAAPIEGAPTGTPRSRLQDHEARQALRLAADAVRHPGPDTGPAELRRTGVNEDFGWGMIEDVRCHRADDRQIIDDTRQMWQQIRDVGTALAMTREAARRPQQFGPFLGKGVHEREAFALDKRFGHRL